ncbi:hypothetical protein [Bacillus alkalisoli]|uniref:hypothetical protein n=1 Tax=Bacillus alkalisoli TaxID=2011008 RepID=UPI000C24CC0B|nr:hypothetical protein [Bacillus alkalisoli]
MDQFATLLMEEYPLTNTHNRELLKNGLQLFRENSVINAYEEGTNIFGKVRDRSQVRHVLMDSDLLELSRCSCGANTICQHQIAVFVSIWAETKPVSQLIEQWKQAGNNNTIQNLVSTYKEDSLKSWLTFVNAEHEQFKRSMPQNNTYLTGIVHVFYHQILKKAPKVAEISPLFKVHAAIFCMEQVIKEEEHHPRAYIESVLNHFVELAENETRALLHHAMSFGLDDLLKESRSIAREFYLSEDEAFLKQKFMMFEQLWSDVYSRRNWTSAELAELTGVSLPVTLAKIHMNFLLKKDKEAISLLNELNDEAAPFVFYWLAKLAEKNAWKQMMDWLEQTDNMLFTYIHNEPGYYEKRRLAGKLLNYINEATNETENDAFYIHALEKLMPYSYREFEWHLFETEQFYHWTDLQLWLGFDISSIDSYKLKEIMKTRPAALLPLYHQCVEKTVAERNRKSYKLAVRYLKKLQQIYKKEKKLHVWETYFEQFQQRTKRLRSLQEEMVKGKILT